MPRRTLPALLALILAGCAGESLPNQMGGALDQKADTVRDTVEPQKAPDYDSGREVNVP